MKKDIIFSLAFIACAFTACQSSESYKNAIVVWSLSDLNDGTSQNSVLQMHDGVSFVTLDGDEAKNSKLRGGDGVAASFNGGWLDAG